MATFIIDCLPTCVHEDAIDREPDHILTLIGWFVYVNLRKGKKSYIFEITSLFIHETVVVSWGLNTLPIVYPVLLIKRGQPPFFGTHYSIKFRPLADPGHPAPPPALTAADLFFIQASIQFQASILLKWFSTPPPSPSFKYSTRQCRRYTERKGLLTAYFYI